MPAPFTQGGLFFGAPPAFESLLPEEKVGGEADRMRWRRERRAVIKSPVEKKGDAKSCLPCVKGGAERSEAEGLA